MNNTHPRVLQALNVLTLVWAGMLLGVSFLATPAKFLAPSLTLPVALDVGRQTFALFSVVEVVGASVLLAAAILGRCERLILILAASVGFLVALEFAWLLPALDARVEIILRGGTPEASSLHSLYIVFEAAKLVLLGAIAWRAHAAFAGHFGRIATDAR
jgi:hypothetical protein